MFKLSRNSYLIFLVKTLALSQLPREFPGPHVVFNLSPEGGEGVPWLVRFIEPHQSDHRDVVIIILRSHDGKVAYIELIVVYFAFAEN